MALVKRLSPRGFGLAIALLVVPVSLFAQSQATIQVGAHVISGTANVDVPRLATAVIQTPAPSPHGSAWVRFVGAASVTIRLVTGSSTTGRPNEPLRPTPTVVVALVEYVAN